MKFLKAIKLVFFSLALLNFNNLEAQLKVLSNGNVGAGTLNPISRFNMVGDAAVFSDAPGWPASAAFIRGNSNFSTPDKPDYTWFNFDQTGMFHPNKNIIGFSFAGSEYIRMSDIGYNFTVFGSGISSAWYIYSDLRFKKSVEPITGALNKVLKIEGKSYEFKTTEFKQRNFENGKKLGFIAQELMEILPEVVKLGSDGYYAVEYYALIPVLVEAIKEQNKKIEALEGFKNEALSNNVKNEFFNNQAKLFQNKPNPFSVNTEIKCIIPESSKVVDLYIYDMQGTQLRKNSIFEKNDVTITIKSEDLKAGMYFYSLIIDGIEIDTKRMILTK